MPQRFLKPGIRTSKRLAKCTRHARLLYVYLITLADDFGRYDGDPQLLRSECFPYDDDVRGSEVEKWVNELSRVGALLHYEVDGSWYVQIQRWKDKARSKLSKYPNPPNLRADVSSLRADARKAQAYTRVTYGEGDGADDGAGEDGTQDFGWLTAPEELVEYSPKVKTLVRFGMQPHRQGGWMAQKVGDFIDANGGEAEALRRLNSAADAGCKTWDEATAWCRRQSWNAADEKAKVTNANSGQAIHGRRIKPT